jgi:hypothetical protein
MTEDIYLGDGVYASFDGYQIWLAVNHHENKQVALDPKVMEALLEYANRVLGWGGTTMAAAIRARGNT